MKNLVIVESPTKAKIIKNFLGKDYLVESSNGHIRDLPDKKSDLPKNQQDLPYATLGVDVQNNFEPLYVIPPLKKKKVMKLKSLLEDTTTIWVATDEDREGEAIGWHLLEVLKPKKQNAVKRIVFHEITKNAILHSIRNPRQLNLDLVNAQQTRRILDRLVGYKLSPLLWSKVRYGLSAGRVQSVAVKIIVDREKEIEAFRQEEYWTLKVILKKEKKIHLIEATLAQINGKKAELKQQPEIDKVMQALEEAQYTVTDIAEKEISKTPPPPFTTSTLQQEAARKLGFSVKKTMLVAQKLYEGKDLGREGSSGLITYMRTDSVNLSPSALTQAQKIVTAQYGKEYALAQPRIYKTKSKGAQEAHEAIRPTDLARLPEKAKDYLDADEFKLYQLIWKRTMATQMQAARFKRVSVDITTEKIGLKDLYLFRATGQTVIFDGFIKLYQEGRDYPEENGEEGEKFLPEVKINENLLFQKFDPSQHFTKPPARYTEAALVKKMEEEGIGRPSTYAPTITTIMSRGYVIKEGNQLKPTDTARVVTDLLEKNFKEIVNLHFTAEMEGHLDDIAEGKIKWVPWLYQFYTPFEKLVEEKSKTIKKQDVISEATNEICELCGKPMVIKLSRYGKFLSCSNYPACKNAKPLQENQEDKAALQALAEQYQNEKCPNCGRKMVLKTGRYGKFLSCENYPKCKTTKAIQISTGVQCPECKKGEMIEKKTRKGKTFYGCNQYPKCNLALWKKPLNVRCKQCGDIMLEKNQKVIVCRVCGAQEDKAE